MDSNHRPPGPEPAPFPSTVSTISYPLLQSTIYNNTVESGGRPNRSGVGTVLGTVPLPTEAVTSVCPISEHAGTAQRERQSTEGSPSPNTGEALKAKWRAEAHDGGDPGNETSLSPSGRILSLNVRLRWMTPPAEQRLTAMVAGIAPEIFMQVRAPARSSKAAPAEATVSAGAAEYWERARLLSCSCRTSPEEPDYQRIGASPNRHGRGRRLFQSAGAADRPAADRTPGPHAPDRRQCSGRGQERPPSRATRDTVHTAAGVRTPAHRSIHARHDRIQDHPVSWVGRQPRTASRSLRVAAFVASILEQEFPFHTHQTESWDDTVCLERQDPALTGVRPISSAQLDTSAATLHRQRRETRTGAESLECVTHLGSALRTHGIGQGVQSAGSCWLLANSE